MRLARLFDMQATHMANIFSIRNKTHAKLSWLSGLEKENWNLLVFLVSAGWREKTRELVD